MTIYFLKTILILGVFYLLYIQFLKSNKTFTWNRAYLLISSLLALLIPFMNKLTFAHETTTSTITQPLTVTLNTINVYASTIQSKELDFGKLIFGIYAVGLLWGLLRMILGFVVIKRVKENSRLEKINEKLIYFNPSIESPFSFNSNIYIPSTFKNQEVLPIILKHEEAHVQLKHSRDKIYFSILQALLWFNPFVYFYHKEIELVHEFEADAFSTQEFDTDDYVQNLLQTISYTQTPTLLAHHFYHHPLKTRIIMLYSKSKNVIMQKALVISSGIIICTALFIIQSYGQTKKKKVEEYKYTINKYPSDTIEVEDPNTGEIKLVITNPKSDTIYELVDQMPEFYGADVEMNKFLSENIVYPKEAQDKKIEGRVIVNFTINNNGRITNVKSIQSPKGGELLAKEAERIVNNMPKWKPGKLKGKPVNVSFTLPIMFQLQK